MIDDDNGMRVVYPTTSRVHDAYISQIPLIFFSAKKKPLLRNEVEDVIYVFRANKTAVTPLPVSDSNLNRISSCKRDTLVRETNDEDICIASFSTLFLVATISRDIYVCARARETKMEQLSKEREIGDRGSVRSRQNILAR